MSNNIALNFLTNIPLTKDANTSNSNKPEKNPLNVASANIKQSTQEKESDPEAKRKRSISLINENINSGNTEAGDSSHEGSVILKKYTQSQTEKKKLAFVTKCSMAPFYISSIVGSSKKRDEGESKKKQKTQETHSATMSDSSPPPTQCVLYADEREKYDPTFLDDPQLTTGKHRTVMHLDCGTCSSIMPYVSKSKLKEEINQRFEEKHPDLRIKLTSIRKIKKNLLQIGLSVDLDLTIIASSYIYFERLILKKVIDKDTKKLYAAICLILATKFYYDCVSKEKIRTLADHLSTYAQQKILPDEIKVYKLLNYTLMNDPLDIRAHFIQLQDDLLNCTTDSVFMKYRSILPTQTFDKEQIFS